MTVYLLDTNHLSPLVTTNHPLRTKILSSAANDDVFAVAAPVLSEFLYGIGTLPRAQQNLKEWTHIKSDFRYYDLTWTDAESAAKLRLLLRSQGWQLSLVDALIAVVALQNDLTLLTTDKDFRGIPDLKQENWR
ncbi:MAG: type II toxin-antitoxin system VapC family toxin [Chloroflexota bacterium]